MPVTLVVLPKSADLPQTQVGGERAVTFDGTRIVLGRASSSDLVLPDGSVSQRHASIRTSGSDYVVVDEGSTNGTYHGETRLTPHLPKTLRTGDRLRLGRIWLEVRVGAAPATANLAFATRDIALALVAEMLESAGGDPCPRLEVQDGPDAGASLRLTQEGRHYIVGRGDTCDLMLADPDCSREHLIFMRKGSQIFAVDLGAKNGSFLGSERLRPHVETRVPPGRLVQLGRTLLVLEEPIEMELAHLDARLEDELLRESDAPAAPPPSRVGPPTTASAPETSPLSFVLSERSPRSAGVPVSAPLGPVSSGGAPSAKPPSSKPPSSPPASLGSATPSTRAPRSQPPARRSRGLRGTDVAVILVALALIGASVAGLYMLVGPGK